MNLLQRLATLLLFALPAVLPDSAFAQTLAVRLFPDKALHTYPLESARDLQGLLLQNIVITNTGPVPLLLSGLELRVRSADGVTDIRRLGGTELQRSAASGARLQAAGQVLLVGHQFMAFRGTPQSVEVQATAVAGPSSCSHHRWVTTQEFALDIVRCGEGNSSHRGDGTRLARLS